MTLFHEMLRKTTSSAHHDKMMRFVVPLKDHFGINHFWYYRVTNSGHYSFLGSHTKWTEFCYAENMVNHFPCLRHPNSLQNGISLMKKTSNTDYRNVLKSARNKFNINFNIQLLKKNPEGIEGFGFATRYDQRIGDEKLLNELPLLSYFIERFRKEHVKLFQLLHDNQVDLSSHLGPLFHEKQKVLQIPYNRELFLKKMGFAAVLSLTKREKDILKYFSHGHSASYIADQLYLSSRTVENYISNIKCKLSCFSKVELIEISKELASFGYFELYTTRG